MDLCNVAVVALMVGGTTLSTLSKSKSTGVRTVIVASSTFYNTQVEKPWEMDKVWQGLWPSQRLVQQQQLCLPHSQ